jgi:hypothetical protein
VLKNALMSNSTIETFKSGSRWALMCDSLLFSGARFPAILNKLEEFSQR